jgi:hypothetical protein
MVGLQERDKTSCERINFNLKLVSTKTEPDTSLDSEAGLNGVRRLETEEGLKEPSATAVESQDEWWGLSRAP